ncbi:MAG: RpiB/LacA/LacB family sugar-phosphate isomerase [Candidatus Beckwithbacteria bacterium]|nr:RpiB/LacA/LacB family sugar-phosphate isomerase [Patescibacteria group bacterium]
MKIFLGADHNGFKLKGKIKKWLKEWGYEYEDMGNSRYEAEDDYVDFAVKVGTAVGLGEVKGVLVCNSGAGMDIVANKIKGVRGVLGFKVSQVKESVEKDGVNVLSIPANYVSLRQVKKILKIFLESKLRQEEKYLRRIKKISNLEKRNFIC